MPQAPLWVTRFRITVSSRPPAITMPVPIGEGVVSGVWGLLLSWTLLCSKIVQEYVPVGPVPWGQAPSWGEGASSLFWLLVTIPLAFLSHSEFFRISLPPAFVPE